MYKQTLSFQPTKGLRMLSTRTCSLKLRFPFFAVAAHLLFPPISLKSALAYDFLCSVIIKASSEFYRTGRWNLVYPKSVFLSQSHAYLTPEQAISSPLGGESYVFCLFGFFLWTLLFVCVYTQGCLLTLNSRSPCLSLPSARIIISIFHQA